MNENRPDTRIPSESGAAEATSAVAPSGPARSAVPSRPMVPEQPARPLSPQTSVGASEGARADADAPRSAGTNRPGADVETLRRTSVTAHESGRKESHPVGTAAGALGGAGVGAVVGIAGGPIGSLVGAVCGAIAGGLLGSSAAGDNPVTEPVTGSADEADAEELEDRRRDDGMPDPNLTGLEIAAASAGNFSTTELTSASNSSGALPPLQPSHRERSPMD